MSADRDPPGQGNGQEIPEYRLDPDDWLTKDGRIFGLDEMDDAHIVAAERVLRLWRRREANRDQVRDLTNWIGKFKREMRRREKARDHETTQADGSGGDDASVPAVLAKTHRRWGSRKMRP
jgi:hypothetical protein